VRRILTLLAATLLLAGCAGANGPAGPALEETAANLAKIESGILTLAVELEPKDGGGYGYEIKGPVKLAPEGKLPLADVTYTQRANGQEDKARLVLTEDGGWVERGGRRTELDERQLSQLRASGSLLGQGGLDDLRFQDWIIDPTLSNGPAGTDKVTAALDVVAAMNGLAGLAGLPGGAKRLEPADREQVEQAIEESSFELLTGDEDRLLRKLSLAVTFATDVPEDLRAAFGEDAVGARFSFDLELDDVNEPVAIGG
jgi:hypothetical protein